MVVTRHAAEPMSKEAGTMSCNTDSMNMTTKDSKLNGDESNNEEEFVVYRHSRRKSSGITNSEEADHIQSDKQNSQGREEYLLRFRQKRSQRKKTLRNFRSMSSYDDGSSEEDGIGALASDSPRKRSFPNMLLRRSGRTRKAVYSTLNASAIEQANHDVDEVRAMEHQERRSKSNNAVEQVKPEVRDLLLAQGKDPTELDKLGQPDIYSSIKSRQRLRRPRRFFDDDDEYHDQNTADRGDDGEKRLDNGAEAAENGNVQEHQHDDEVEGDDDDDDDDDEQPRRYSLRTKRPQTQRLVYELEQQQQHLHRNRPERNLFEQACIGSSSARRKSRRSESSRNLPHAHESTNSPYQHKHRRINSQGASSSETTSQSEDESKFKRRKERSMMKARNRCLPMNLTMADVAGHGFAKERKKIGSSLADVDPMAIDKSVKFSSIGGHDKHLRSLKEMVVFPLLYPEVFEKFNIQPPRGCLFYGPPGTGKTLMARALANECSSEGRKVAFFMRKGADCLSKWVGESERQLRLLFDQAYQMRPSIIFFDEIDGLAPVRSSRQDQIHSSIVSTLLALMDGLDSRGEIVVIGATNRIDSIDPALRRPGRFDREFLFPLPDKKAREEIIRIHTHNWNPPLDKEFVTRLAEKSAGYCGADVKALCTESALIALRHRYPQIYSTNEKLKLDLDNVRIGQRHFIKAMQVITPTAQRSVPNPAHPLSPCIKPLVEANLARSVSQLAKVFPLLYKTSKILQSQCDDPPPQSDSDMSDDEVSSPLPPPNGFALPSTSASLSLRDTVVHRPRYLVCGNSKDGLGGHLVPALLHDLEGLPVHTIDIPTIYGSSARTPEEGCAQIFREAQRTAPSVIYLPDAPTWWSSASNTIQFTFESLLRSIPASSPVLLIATATCSFDEMCRRFKQLFAANFGEVFVVTRPTCEERSKFFAPLFLDLACRPPRTNFKRAAILEHEVLEKAAPVEGARLTEKELEKLEAQEESTMRSLRLFLRDVLTRLAQDRRFKLFLNPVDVEEVEDYLEVIKHPMDLSTMMNKIDKHCYGNVTSFVQDIDLICSNALEYNPERYAEERAIRHRACLLKDMCHAIVEEELAPTFERFCNEVCEARTKRRAAPEKFAPSYCHVLPRPKLQSSNNQTAAIPTITGRHRLSSELSKSCRKRKRKLKSRWAMGIVGKKTKKRKLESEEEHTEGEEAHGEAASTEEEDEEGHADGTEEKDAERKNEEEVVELEDQQVSDVNMSDEDDPHPTTPTTTPPPQDAESDTCGDDEHSDDDEEVAESDDGENHEDHAGDEDGEDGVEDEDHEDHVEDDEGENHDDDVEDEDHEDHVEDDEGQESDEKTARIVPASSDNGSLDQDPKLATDPKASAENCPDDSNEAEMPEVTSSPPTPVAACDVKIEEVEENGGHIADAGGGGGGGGGEVENEVSAMKLRPRTRTTEAEKPPVYVPRPNPPVVVDRATLQLILNDCVRKTSKFRVDELERIFSLLAKTVHQHRSNYDKTLLTQELEQVVQSLSRPVT